MCTTACYSDRELTILRHSRVTNCVLHCFPQIIICIFCPFLIFPLIYFVPDEHHEREAAARRSQKSLFQKSLKNVRRASNTGDGVELQKIETVNGNPKLSEDEEATVGGDGEDLVDYVPGKGFILPRFSIANYGQHSLQ